MQNIMRGIDNRIAGGSCSHLSHRMSYVGIFKLSTQYLIADIDIIFFKKLHLKYIKYLQTFWDI